MEERAGELIVIKYKGQNFITLKHMIFLNLFESNKKKLVVTTKQSLRKSSTQCVFERLQIGQTLESKGALLAVATI